MGLYWVLQSINLHSNFNSNCLVQGLITLYSNLSDIQYKVSVYSCFDKGCPKYPIYFNQSSESILPVISSSVFAVRSRHFGFWALIEIYWVFLRLPFGIVAYAFTVFWTNFVEIAVYTYLILGIGQVRVRSVHCSSPLEILGFIRVVPTNTGTFLRSLNLCEESRT